MGYDTLEKIKYSDRDNYEKIYQERYNSSSTYKYSFEVKGFKAFVVITQEVLALISDVLRLDKKLNKIQQDLPNVAKYQFTQKCLIDEIHQSNDLEGVASTRKEIKESLDKKVPGGRFEGIVNKYELLNTNEKIPLSDCADIRKLYDEILLDEVRKSDKEDIPDGDIFRKGKVYVKDKNTGKSIHEGLYPETKIMETMSALLNSLKNSEYNELVNVAVTHYMFGYIHPFYDGNGRLSRFISSYLLSDTLEKIVSYRIAYTIKQDINSYYKIFKITNSSYNRGDLTPFTIYFLKLIKKSISELIEYFEEKSVRLQYFIEKLFGLDKSKDYKNVLDILIQNAMFGFEGISVNELSEILNESEYIIRKNIKLIENDELAKKTKAKPYLYTANLAKLETV